MQRHLIIVIAASLFLLAASLAHAEDGSHGGQGYVFFAPGALVQNGSHLGMVHFGGGGEGLLYKGLGAGAELGYVAPWQETSNGIGLLSLNGSYQFQRNRKVSPFVTLGYSLGFRSGHINMINFGGGAHWWFANRVGLRMEFRDHLYSRTDLHYLEGRIGLSFR